MKNQKKDHVSPFLKGIIDRVHGGRKHDSKFWERTIENSRNDYDDFSNGEIPIEQPEGLAQTLKQARAKRVVLILGVVLVCFVFALVYSRPNLFPFLSYSKIYQAISEYFPEKYEVKNKIRESLYLQAGLGFDSRCLNQVPEITEEVEFFMYVSPSLSARIIRKVMTER